MTIFSSHSFAAYFTGVAIPVQTHWRVLCYKGAQERRHPCERRGDHCFLLAFVFHY